MPHDKNCHNCGKPFAGNINRRFCSDACRKYYKRHGEVSLAGVAGPLNADKTGQGRTTPRAGGSNLGNYAAKKGIDVVAKLIENSLIPPKLPVATRPVAPLNSSVDRPLQTFSADALLNDPLTEWSLDKVDLSQAWQAFLGEITFPFKMLVWGLPGSGKSTFSMQLANEIARQHRLLYVAGEEGLSSQTLLDKQRRVITANNAKNCIFMNRLPRNEGEWNQVLYPDGPSLLMTCKTIFYDSVTKLGISPFYVDAAANDYRLPIFSESLSHIFITHAHKDGQQYRGNGSWGHEVDVIIRVEQGVATTEKNRFGEVGRTWRVF